MTIERRSAEGLVQLVTNIYLGDPATLAEDTHPNVQPLADRRTTLGCQCGLERASTRSLSRDGQAQDKGGPPLLG